MVRSPILLVPRSLGSAITISPSRRRSVCTVFGPSAGTGPARPLGELLPSPISNALVINSREAVEQLYSFENATLGIGLLNCMNAVKKNGYLNLYFYRAGTFIKFLVFMIRDLIKGDKDIDLETLTYSCFFDQKIDQSVGENKCSTLRGSNFDSKTGKLNWNPDFFQSGK